MAITKHPLYVRALFACVTIFWGTWIVLGALARFLSGPKKFLSAGDYSKVPPCALDPSLGEHNTIVIPTVDCGNLKIKYVSNGEKGKPLMLLLHGFPESWYSWRFQLKDLCDQYWLVAVDTRGYGESDKPRGLEHYALDNLVEDVPAVIKALGYEKATVVGHDWGGAITWLFAGKYPEMCEKIIVLNCPYPAVHRKRLTSSIRQFLASWYMFYFLIPYLPEIVMKSHDYSMLAATLRGKKGGVRNRENMTKEDLDVFKYSLHTWESREAGHNYIRANFTYTPTLSKGKLTPPILLLWGTADLFLTKELAGASTKYAENCKLIYIEGASHWVQQDHPQDVNRHIRDFMASG